MSGKTFSANLLSVIYRSIILVNVFLLRYGEKEVAFLYLPFELSFLNDCQMHVCLPDGSSNICSYFCKTVTTLESRCMTLAHVCPNFFWK